MNCEQIEQLRVAYGDRELTTRDALEVEAHLAGCAACQAALADQTTLSASVKRHADYFDAPTHLEHRIRAALPQGSNTLTTPLRSLGWRWFAPALGAAFGVALTVGFLAHQPSADSILADEAVSSHVRSLLTDRITDVASSDRHTVKPWFAGKLDFSPPVRDLAGDDYPLIGGRLDYFGHRTVAALVYRHRQHLINLFVAPIPGGRVDAEPHAVSTQGYQVVEWRAGGMAFWAVSDLNEPELAQFVGLLRKSGG